MSVRPGRRDTVPLGWQSEAHGGIGHVALGAGAGALHDFGVEVDEERLASLCRRTPPITT